MPLLFCSFVHQAEKHREQARSYAKATRERNGGLDAAAVPGWPAPDPYAKVWIRFRQPRPMRASTFRRLMNLWPPFLCNGIRVLSISDDYREAHVALRLRPWNRNYVKSQFGGNLFAMTDPFWMLLVMHQLGGDYYVWDKAGAIDFVAPGREDVYARFRLEPAVVEELRAAAAGGEKVLRWFETDVATASGEVVARVRKQVYVRLKPRAR
jgi:acyl-coenzyme A thioesterase PaaI-like protein